MQCPLCLSHQFKDITGSDHRNYYLCKNCHLVFADPKHFLSRLEEAARYKKHGNDIHNEGYISFLNKVV